MGIEAQVLLPEPGAEPHWPVKFSLQDLLLSIALISAAVGIASISIRNGEGGYFRIYLSSLSIAFLIVITALLVQGFPLCLLK